MFVDGSSDCCCVVGWLARCVASPDEKIQKEYVVTVVEPFQGELILFDLI